VDIPITIMLNCLDSPVVEHNLLAQNITCWAYTDTINADRPIYLAWYLADNSLNILTLIINFHYSLGVNYDLH
jgi:hypothetical protein